MVNLLRVHFFDIVFVRLVGVHLFDIVFSLLWGPLFRHCFFSFLEGLQALGGSSSFFSWNFTSNAIRIMSGDPLEPELWTYLWKHVFLSRTLWVRPMVKKSLKNYIECYSQSTKRLICGQRYEHVCDIILWHYDSLIIYVTYCTILYYIVLYYTLLYYTIHLFTVLYCMIS